MMILGALVFFVLPISILIFGIILDHDSEVIFKILGFTFLLISFIALISSHVEINETIEHEEFYRSKDKDYRGDGFEYSMLRYKKQNKTIFDIFIPDIVEEY